MAPIGGFVLVLAMVIAGCGLARPLDSARAGTSGRIASVIDGDTVKVRTRVGLITVRLIGIDTPESKRPGVAIECGAREATSSMYDLSFRRPIDRDGDGLFDAARGRGRRVVLRGDPTQERIDRYGRRLAYIDRPGRGNLQQGQLRRGWASVYVYRGQRFRRLGSFRAAARIAERAGRGVWGICAGDFHREPR